jgi:hypothetical protein
VGIRSRPNCRARWLLVCLLALCFTRPAGAQDNYEIQVYGSELVPRGATMVEFHTNFTAQGSKQVSDGVLPTNHGYVLLARSSQACE